MGKSSLKRVKTKRSNKKKRYIYNLLLALCITVFVVSGALLVNDLIPRIKASQEMSVIQQSSPVSEEVTDTTPSLAELKKINPEIVAWIHIDSTNIDFPVLQCSNNEYYLHRTYTEEYNDAGSIFMDYHNDPLFADQNTVIYGHARKDGTMFSQLGKYKKQSGYDESPFIQIVTEGKIYFYQIFSANVLEASDDYRNPSYGEDFMSFVNQMRNSSQITSNAKVDENSKILTLSTCTNVIADGRLAVFAVLLNPDGGKININDFKK